MKRIIVAILAGLTVFGAVFAMAATLNGITGQKLGADDAAVASCDTDGVTSDYTSAWDATDKRYEVGTVTIGGVADACDGGTLKVTLADGTGSINEMTLAIPASAAVSFNLTPSPAPASEAVAAVHVSILKS